MDVHLRHHPAFAPYWGRACVRPARLPALAAARAGTMPSGSTRGARQTRRTINRGGARHRSAESGKLYRLQHPTPCATPEQGYLFLGTMPHRRSGVVRLVSWNINRSPDACAELNEMGDVDVALLQEVGKRAPGATRKRADLPYRLAATQHAPAHRQRKSARLCLRLPGVPRQGASARHERCRRIWTKRPLPDTDRCAVA